MAKQMTVEMRHKIYQWSWGKLKLLCGNGKKMTVEMRNKIYACAVEGN